ncbi:MAG TPA: hypothetical protein VL098_01900 [Flavipsychrobacter sp.]|nr:hypothetical protein [Flavipsychrobacter sp.]
MFTDQVRNALKFYAIPLIALIIASWQVSHIQYGLSRWKGGGFGMYTEVHADSRQLVVNDSLIVYDSLRDNKKIRLIFKNYLFYPRKKYCSSLMEQLKIEDDTAKLEIWLPEYDAKMNLLTRKKIHEYIHIED